MIKNWPTYVFESIHSNPFIRSKNCVIFLQDFRLVRCYSLDAESRFDREAITPIEQMTFDSEGSDPTGNLGPSPGELAQCEAEMGTLLRIIAELNQKMGSLKAPR